MNDDVRLRALSVAARVVFAAVPVVDAAACAPDPAPPPANPPHWSCEAIVNRAFPIEGDYRPHERGPADPEVARCCTERLAREGSAGKHRWDCCAVYEEPKDPKASQELGIACTPWGPPVPPAFIVRAADTIELHSC